VEAEIRLWMGAERTINVGGLDRPEYKQLRDAAVHTHMYDFHNVEDRAATIGSGQGRIIDWTAHTTKASGGIRSAAPARSR
jgi:hypothetical protein